MIIRASGVPRCRWSVLVVCSLLALAMGGCASMGKKFVSGTKANIGLFADNTVAMLGTIDLSMDRNEAVLVRRFFDESGDEARRMVALSTNMKAVLQNVVDYSVSLVNIAESGRPEPELVKGYADLITRFKNDIIYGAQISDAEFEAALESVRQQPDLLAALRAAQPTINSAVVNSIKELNELTAAIDAVAAKMDAQIDVEYADVIRYRKKTEDEKARILEAFEIVYDAYRTDDPDLSALATGGSIWTPEIIPKGRPTRDDLRAIGNHLRARLDALHTVQQEIDPYWEDYRASHRELDDLADKAVARVNRARLILIVWVRAHQKMATGVIDPAEWFDINNAPAQLLDIGVKLL